MLQLDLNERTHIYQEKVAGLPQPQDEPMRASLLREAQELAEEQGTLAELVEKMLTRDNKKNAP